MITTVIPTFERSAMLRRAIESALAQDVDGHEVHVCDNASTDDTAAVVAEYVARDPRVKYFVNSENIGGARNIMSALARVSTQYYSLLSDDDFLLPNFYAQALQSFAENPEAGFVCTKTLTVDTIHERVEFRNRDWQAGVYQPGPEISRKMAVSHFVTTSVVFSSRVRMQLGPFDPSGSDSLYMTMAALVFPFVVVNSYGAAVLLHESAYSIMGEGISQEKIPTLYAHLVKTISTVTAAELPEKTKALLFMQVMHAYHQMFDTKRLKGALYGLDEPHQAELFMLPSFINNRGMVVKLFNASPSVIKPLVKFLYQILNKLNRTKAASKMAEGWTPIGPETMEMLSRYEPDVKRLNFVEPVSKPVKSL